MYKLNSYAKPMSPFAWWENAFSEEELDWLQQQARSASLVAQVSGSENQSVNTEIRRSKVSWLDTIPENNWVYDRISSVASSLNADYFGFDLEYLEMLQLTNYVETNKGTYGWHQDFGYNCPRRKLSLVLQLSDPQDYDGGELKIKHKPQAEIMSKKRGVITAFPAWTLHQVSPVIRGNRQSLVAWVSGEPFR